MESINVDGMFRDSRAKKVAQRLLTGKTFTRQELAERHNVPVTTINRVVTRLTEAGAVILRELPDGRHAAFTVVEVKEPKQRLAFPDLGESGTVVRDELVADEHVVDVQVDSGKRLRGVLDRALTPFQAPTVGTEVLVMGVLQEERGATLLFKTCSGSKQLRLTNAQNVLPQ